MQMSIVQKELDINSVDGVGESTQWAVNVNGLREKAHICNALFISIIGYVWYSSLLSIVAFRIKYIAKHRSKYHIKYHGEEERWLTLIDYVFGHDVQSSMSAYEALFLKRNLNSMRHSYLKNHWADNPVDLYQEYLTSQMRTRVYHTYGNYGHLRERILHLQKEDTFTRDLFVLEETRLSHSAYTNVPTFFVGDGRLLWADHAILLCFWKRQLYREAERFFLARTVSKYLIELHEIANLHQYCLANRPLRCRNFSSGFTMLTYNFKLPMRFCALSHHAPKLEMLSPSSSERELYTSIVYQENSIIDISMVIFSEYVRMLWYQTAEMCF